MLYGGVVHRSPLGAADDAVNDAEAGAGFICSQPMMGYAAVLANRFWVNSTAVRKTLNAKPIKRFK